MTDRPTDRPTEDELLLELENPEVKDTFRFRCARALVTYRTHVNKERLREFLETKSGDNNKVLKCYIAHECGKDDPLTPYEHTHVCVKWAKALDKKSSRFLDFAIGEDDDYELIHPHIRSITSDVAWRRACKYITKEDSSVKVDELDLTSVVDLIQSCKSLNEAFEKNIPIHTIRSAQAIKLLYEAKQKPRKLPKYPVDKLLPWQKIIHDYCFEPVDDRKVLWIVNPNGCRGKTQLIKTMFRTYPDKCWKVCTIGRVADFAQNLSRKLETGWEGDTIFLNMTKSKENNKSVYEVLECIKDGDFTSTKYQGADIDEDEKHCIVFANHYPNVDATSLDRWDVRQLEDDGTLTNLSLKQVRLRWDESHPPVTLEKGGGYGNWGK